MENAPSPCLKEPGPQESKQVGSKRIITRITALCFCAFSITIIIIARTYTYLSPNGPGPGFFPLWLGSILLVLSLIWVAQLVLERSADSEDDSLAPKGAIMPIIATVGGSLLYAFLLPILGYPISMLMYLMLLFAVISKARIWVCAVSAVGASLGSYALLVFGMGIQLPQSPFPFLQSLGL